VRDVFLVFSSLHIKVNSDGVCRTRWWSWHLQASLVPRWKQASTSTNQETNDILQHNQHPRFSDNRPHSLNVRLSLSTNAKMKIATLQLDSKIRNVDHNIATADRILLSTPPPPDLDLLVLPELAFTGYNYPSYDSIKPYLEPTTAGVTTKWAISIAKRLGCHVIVGYPELSTDIDDTVQPSSNGTSLNPVYKRYNSTVTVSPTGDILANYRKSFLYYTDESWAAESPTGFFCDTISSFGKVALGICMDINPYQFEAPWDKYEFARNALAGGAKLIVMSMAWLTSLPIEEMAVSPDQPALETVSYWLQRFSPLIEATQAGGEDILVVFSNRTGNEKNEVSELTTKTGQVIPLGESVNYAGSSCAMRFSGGSVSILDMMGKGEEGLLVIDTHEVSYSNINSRFI
jgi:protein N-terminal amidase